MPPIWINKIHMDKTSRTDVEYLKFENIDEFKKELINMIKSLHTGNDINDKNGWCVAKTSYSDKQYIMYKHCYYEIERKKYELTKEDIQIINSIYIDQKSLVIDNKTIPLSYVFIDIIHAPDPIKDLEEILDKNP